MQARTHDMTPTEMPSKSSFLVFIRIIWNKEYGLRKKKYSWQTSSTLIRSELNEEH
jgi:hypothetical protein